MPKPLTSTQDTVNPTLLAFKPRQVLLANLDMKKHSKPNGSENRTQTLRPDQKGLLLHSVARFLERNGFSKTFKNFLSEAEIEKNGLKDSLVDLEEMYCKYSEMCLWDEIQWTYTQCCLPDCHNTQCICVNGGTNVNSQTEKDTHTGGNSKRVTEELKDPEQLLEEAGKKSKEKKKKKCKIVSDSLADTVEQQQLESLPGAAEENSQDADHAVPLKGKGVSDSKTEKKSKEKKKKKKSDSDSVSHNVEQCGLEATQDANGMAESIADDNLGDEKSVKPKGKKKKKGGLVSGSLGDEDKNVLQDTNGTISKKDDFKISDVDATDKENKGSKKRKRLASEGNDSQPADNKEDEESKRRKVENLKESMGSEQPANSNASLGRAENVGKESKGESGQVGLDVFQKTPAKQLEGQANGNLDRSAEKSSIQQSMKKQCNGSVEPTTFKAFQRVKVDEVEFTDEKLRDNSYWAKDGAEIGYGAKAQEILGQVRGRDFRHEKTKKKRGSYRGGQIDLQSHSVKFNYDDED